MIKKMRFLAVAALLVIAPIESAVSDDSGSEAVERQFQKFMGAWKSSDFETVWDMLSPRLRRGNDDSLAK